MTQKPSPPNKPKGRTIPLLLLSLTLMLVIGSATLACGGDDTLTVYSGRSQELVDPLLERFTEQTGVKVQVKYAGSSAIAGTILEEGDNTPADVVFLQDPGSLGMLADSGVLDTLPDDVLARVPANFRSPDGLWIGASGRARVLVYNTEAIDPDTDLPASILDFTDPEWRGRIGWAPTNGSFQTFVTGFRVSRGEDAARDWLAGIHANDPRSYSGNTAIVAGVARGEVDVGFVNHYYLLRFLEEEGPGFGARNQFLGDGDPGSLVMVAGAGIVAESDSKDAAQQFIDFLLSDYAQGYFARETKEYPLVSGIALDPELPPLDSLDPVQVDIGALSDLEGTLELLREVGITP